MATVEEELPIRVHSVNAKNDQWFVIKRFKTRVEAEAWVTLYRAERPAQYYIDHEEEV